MFNQLTICNLSVGKSMAAAHVVMLRSISDNVSAGDMDGGVGHLVVFLCLG